jgi:hypothetical protein
MDRRRKPTRVLTAAREIMPEQQAVETLAGLHNAIRALKQMPAVGAASRLLNPERKSTTGSLGARRFNISLMNIRSTFDEMDRKGIKFP